MRSLKLPGKIKSHFTNIKFLLAISIFGLCVLNFSGCAVKKSALPLDIIPKTAISGITHAVQKGETLWRISRIYDVDLDRLALANNIGDRTRINAGQLLVIPGIKAKPRKDLSGITDKDSYGFIWPVKGEVISYFSDANEHLITKGVIIKTKLGADVLCARSGIVAFSADNLTGYGRILIINHDDGFSTVYGGISGNLAKLNDHVSQGAIIAKAGIDKRSGVPALLFQIRKGALPKNPLYYLP